MEYKTLNMRVRPHKALRLHCAQLDIPMGEFVELAVSEKIERDSHE